jgi:succinyl-CoA synthetase alpha subunit
MAIYVDEETRLLIQGATTRIARKIIPPLQDFGTNVVAGVSPNRGGETVSGVPIYHTVRDAVSNHHLNSSLVIVPAPYVKDACLESIDVGIESIIAIAEGVPIHDTIILSEYATYNDVTLIGPNTVGVVSPGKSAVSMTSVAEEWYSDGPVGVVARSGTLSIEIASSLTELGVGQSTVLSVGGDPHIGTPPGDTVEEFDSDPDTEAVAYIGEIGGPFESDLADTLGNIDTPVYASIVGRHAPTGKQMGHAGAITENKQDKLTMLADSGAITTNSPFKLPQMIEQNI